MGFAAGLLHVDSNEDGSVLRQRWSGTARELKPAEALDGYFAPFIERARAGGLTLEHHFEKLEYFNSSFIAWVVRHLRRTFDVEVKTVVYFEPTSHMHRSSFDALKFLQRDNPWLQVLEAKEAP
jgi:hypothetical protein